MLNCLALIRSGCRGIAKCKVSYDAAVSNDLAHWFQRAVTDMSCQRLSNEGYVVIEEVLPDDLCRQLRAEVLHMHDEKMMHLNHTHLVGKNGSTALLAKHSIYEAEITMDAKLKASAPTAALFQSDSSLRVLLSVHLPFLTLGSSATKLQVNSGLGGCFPLHFDSDERLDGRKVTSIFYLNPPNSAAKGGQLRLYPWPRSAPIDIGPINNRLVLFSSTRMLQRVLPFSCDQNDKSALRVCFTVWLSSVQRRRGGGRRDIGPSPSKALSSTTATRNEKYKALVHPDIRQHVLRLVYEDEWRQSILEAHPEGEGRASAIREFDLSVIKIRSALSQHKDLIDEMNRCQYQDVPWFQS